MLPGIENRNNKVSEYRKVAEIDGELQRLNLDIVALQETAFRQEREGYMELDLRYVIPLLLQLVHPPVTLSV